MLYIVVYDEIEILCLNLVNIKDNKNNNKIKKKRKAYLQNKFFSHHLGSKYKFSHVKEIGRRAK